MRPLFSLLLSLAMFASIVGVQISTAWSAFYQEQVAEVYMLELTHVDAEVLQGLEEDLGLEPESLQEYPVAFALDANSAQEDRTELFGAPEQPAVGVAHAWVPPSAPLTYLTHPWPRSMMRPPNSSLMHAGWTTLA